jgi:SAM-dependent methyltransferase
VRLIGNRWRRWNFTLMAPFYDAIVSPFLAMRYRSIELADVKPGDRVLLVGAGTGADVPLLPRTCTVFATDFTEAMLRRVLKPGGRVAVFDKFKPEGQDAPLLLRLIRPFALALGTDVTVDLDDLAARAGLRFAHREKGFADGLFQVVLLERAD